jgi:hypothetical protein
MANAQLLMYGPKHLGQNFFFYCFCLDRFFPEEPDLLSTIVLVETSSTAV